MGLRRRVRLLSHAHLGFAGMVSHLQPPSPPHRTRRSPPFSRVNKPMRHDIRSGARDAAWSVMVRTESRFRTFSFRVLPRDAGAIPPVPRADSDHRVQVGDLHSAPGLVVLLL